MSSITVKVQIVHRGGGTGSFLKMIMNESDTTEVIRNRLVDQLKMDAAIDHSSSIQLIIDGHLVPEDSIPSVDFGLRDGSTIVAVVPVNEVSAYRRVCASLCSFLYEIVKILRSFFELLRGSMASFWMDPWALVRPKEYYSTAAQHVDITPTARAQHAPGQNPNGEDLSHWMLQGMAGMG
ncbi:hypothetical protein FOL47_003663 [Perkinsus chesapeaki]|uniref:Ubiquitin-like domain-containing protein n=1 Tax=Perkinsus chesapeaki TaxID=330153 RepID=A0A7J6M873_PERCH|nr:hypothetical protein FOL47_003663 [Perkinsus chesapeaki]